MSFRKGGKVRTAEKWGMDRHNTEAFGVLSIQM
jgi:hypothetical protein